MQERRRGFPPMSIARPWRASPLDRIARPGTGKDQAAAPRVASCLPWGWALSVMLCLALAGPGVADAKDSSARKLGRGFANLGLGVIALPGEVVETTREKGPFMGATWGVVKGVGMTVVTELVGVWEIVTCPFQFPPDWKPILSPEFPWQHFQADQRVDPARRTPPPRVR